MLDSDARRIITLLTDFGTSDGYVAAVKGVVLGVNPNATLVDVTHEVRPQDVAGAAFLWRRRPRTSPRARFIWRWWTPGLARTGVRCCS